MTKPTADLRPIYEQETQFARCNYSPSQAATVTFRLHGGVDDLKHFEGIKAGTRVYICAYEIVNEEEGSACQHPEWDYKTETVRCQVCRKPREEIYADAGHPMVWNPDPAAVPPAEDSEPSLAPSADETGLVTNELSTTPVVDNETAPEHTQMTGGQFVKELLLSGVFNRPEVLAHIGSDKLFQIWVRQQPSCISGQTPCVYAHVRRANNSGVGMKPNYSGVPLTDEEHKHQHADGEKALLCDYGIVTSGFLQDAKDWFDRKAAWYRWDWATKTIAQRHGHESRKEIPADGWRFWFDHHEIDLPRQLQ